MPQHTPAHQTPTTGGMPAIGGSFNLGGTIAGQQQQPTDAGFMNRVQGFMQIFERPEVQAGLLQAGIRLMQPTPPGQTPLGQVGVALGEGAAAAGRVQKNQATAADLDRQRKLQERQTVVQERRATTEETAEKRLSTQGERRLDLQDLELEQAKTLAGQKMQLERDLAQETNSLKRQELAQKLSLTNRQLDIEKQKLDARRAAATTDVEVAQINAMSRILQNLVFMPDMDPNQVGRGIKEGVDIMQGRAPSEDPVVSRLKATKRPLTEIPDTLWAKIASDPMAQWRMRQAYNDPESHAFIQQKIIEHTGQSR